MRATVKRCRHHAIGGPAVFTRYVSYERGRYRTLHIYGTAVVVPKYARFISYLVVLPTILGRM